MRTSVLYNIVALNKGSRAAIDTPSLPLTSRVRQYRQLNSTRNKISNVGDRNAVSETIAQKPAHSQDLEIRGAAYAI